MQNLHIIQGRPSWSAQFIIAMINGSGKYKTELQYELTGKGMDMECFAYTYDNYDRKVVVPPISMSMADKEGWLGKSGSKWKTMSETMIRYRAASFFGRLNCPELVMGIYSEEEVIDLPSGEYSVNNAPNPSPGEAAYAQSAASVAATYTADEPPSANATRRIDETAPSQTAPAPENGNNSPAYGEVVDRPQPHSQNGNGSYNGGAVQNNIGRGGGQLECADCGAVITKAEQGYSIGKFGRALCRACQNKAKGN
jgi:hypothetical protein